MIFLIGYHQVIECNNDTQGNPYISSTRGNYIIKYHSIIELVLLKIESWRHHSCIVC